MQVKKLYNFYPFDKQQFELTKILCSFSNGYIAFSDIFLWFNIKYLNDIEQCKNVLVFAYKESMILPKFPSCVVYMR
jgi:hypothetical protein